MIELTEIIISNHADIVEARNKLFNLLLNLSFKDMESVRIVTKISDFMHFIYEKEKPVKIKLIFTKRNNKNYLLINFEIKNLSIEIIRKNCMLENVEFSSHENKEIIELHMIFYIEDNDFKLTNEVVNDLRENIVVQSKTELLREIKHKNVELNKLLNDLKRSATLIQSEKMRALGVLTAGVAHELNNPLMGVLNFVQYALKKTIPDDKRYEPLKDAEHEIKRCIDIVTNLLTFSHLEKEGDSNLKPVNLTVLIKRILKILSYRLRNEGINVKEEITDNLPSINGHENRLQQALLNLVINSIDAMKNMKTKILGIRIDKKKQNIEISISDTGIGMSQETKTKIFEPFFTTKPTGSGTGLGLSVTSSIIKEHKGKIVCQSEENIGTKFLVILPLELKE